ncbi:diguanylate cyclase (GGDEF) domain-containing protein [Peptoclostridium litorale DSM 5388]|uniref:Diguanylate cyclase n=1 Tax=Peptoclostridium litorale DSM 5388 TaxID=1121324 RepID=A0A069RNU3_PEPLI|nr:bifunctional diguanylate cyclase/phosphodiesterase [Peptoclostridium litorale]KDR95852.1 diguanylate cyclase [Peptoclostridium litorale DSM 5388]SIO11352.1 diguanylate cyclase (GGDEF) domain-containing protein [Peptoclostridium litorale DSM 5388]
MNKKLISENKKNKKTIHKLSYYDSLTGLFNRESLYMHLKNLCLNKDEFSVIFFDIDKLKAINDTLGYFNGDRVIKKIAAMLRALAYENCRLYRWGGDEFVFLLKENNSLMRAESLSKKILNLFEYPIKIKDNELFITGSIGISNYPKDAIDFEGLLKKATTALHHSKDMGRNSYRVHDERISEKALNKVLLETKLRVALLKDEFHVYYQPKVNIRSGKIVGMEALVRWIDSEGRIISPAEFIPIAEETGLIQKIGDIVLKRACMQTKAMADEGYDLCVSVNLSARQFEDMNLIEKIEEALNQANLESKYLELEITDNTIMNTLDTSIEIIKKIRKRGIKVSLDDFGTGYSSLNYLVQMPIDILKIDKVFIDKKFDAKKQRIILESVISLAKKMDLKVIAEGVERLQQLDFLKSQGCDEFQGYYFSRPLPIEEFKRLLNYNRNICLSRKHADCRTTNKNS